MEQTSCSNELYVENELFLVGHSQNLKIRARERPTSSRQVTEAFSWTLTVVASGQKIALFNARRGLLGEPYITRRLRLRSDVSLAQLHRQTLELLHRFASVVAEIENRFFTVNCSEFRLKNV